MQRPKIYFFDKKDQGDIILEKGDITVSKKDGSIIISSNREQRSIKASPEDWYDYGLHVFTPESAQKSVDIMFDYDEIMEKPDTNIDEDNFSPAVFKVFHKESGFFSRKGNSNKEPRKKNDGDWDKNSTGWSKSIGSIWSTQTHAILHIKSMFRYTIRPDLFKTGDEYYKERDLAISKYGVLAMDNEGKIKNYEAIDLVPKTESHKIWEDYSKWQNIIETEGKMAKQKIKERKKRLNDLKIRS